MKALTVGGAMIDTIAIIESDHIERMSMRNADASFLLIEEGRKTESLEVSTHCGGGAVNTAVAMARLGLDVATIISIGEDARANLLLARLAEEGIATRWIKRVANAPTGASVLVSSHERNAAVFTFRGANTLLRPADMADDAFEVDLVYVSNLSSRSADCYPETIVKAKAHGALVAVNPGMRQLTVDAKEFIGGLERIDILAINRKEADAMAPALAARAKELRAGVLKPEGDVPELLARGVGNGASQMSLPAFMGTLRAAGTKYVVITDSRSGAWVHTRDEIQYCAGLDTEVAGTAGAGDAFAATFAAYVALGEPSDTALKAATINASCVIGHVDTQTGLLKRDVIDARLKGSDMPRVRRWTM